jgi:hypothetical protein
MATESPKKSPASFRFVALQFRDLAPARRSLREHVGPTGLGIVTRRANNYRVARDGDGTPEAITD